MVPETVAASPGTEPPPLAPAATKFTLVTPAGTTHCCITNPAAPNVTVTGASTDGCTPEAVVRITPAAKSPIAHKEATTR